MKKLAILLLMCGSANAQSYLNFDELRAKGLLSNPFGNENKLTYCFENQNCIVIGTVRKDNIVEWNDNVTIDMLKRIIQTQQDMTAYKALEYKRFLDK